MRTIIDGVEHDERISVCFDTCHTHDAGYDTKDDFDKVVEEFDRIVGKEINNKKALIVVDIEGAEYMLLQGARSVIKNEVKPIWMIEITTTEHQPNLEMNKYFRKTFELFFDNGYEAFTADDARQQIKRSDLDLIESRALILTTHNFIFR